MALRVSLLVAVVSGLLILSGCSSDPTSSAPNPKVTTPSTSTNVPTPAVTSSSEPTPALTPVESPEAEIEAAPTPAEPFVVECLFGTPGPARWSDGTTRFSQWCFDELDGDVYLRSEREANTFECDGYVCRNPYNGATRPDPDAVTPVPTGTTSGRGYSCNSNECYWPDGSFVIGADRCGLLCGEPPTSGDIQTRSGCEAGYITDPDLCRSVGN